MERHLLSDNNRSLLKAIVTLAWPTVVEQTLQTAAQYVDTAMVGTLGTDATASVGSTGTVNMLIMATLMAMGIGFLALISQSIGAKKYDQVKKISAQAVFVTIIAGILAMVLTLSLSSVIPKWMRVDPAIQDLASTYFFFFNTTIFLRVANVIFGTLLRGAGDTKTPMRIGIIVNVMNVVLNFLLIYAPRTITIFGFSFHMIGAGLGVKGAAIASALAYAFGGSAMTYKLFKHPVVSPRGESIWPNMAILRPCFRIAIPNMLQRMITSFGFVFFSSMVNSIGEVATAAHTVANTVESAFYIPCMGMQTAASTLAGNAKGARDRDRLNGLSRVFLVLVAILMAMTGCLLFLFAPNLVRLFSHDPEVITLGSTVLRMVAVSEPFYGVSRITEGMMQGLGNTMIPLEFNIIGMWGIRIAGTFICTQILGLGLIAVWACMIANNMTLFFMYLVIYLNGRWAREKDSSRKRKSGQ